MGALMSLSKSETSYCLSASECALLLFALIVVVGLIGENKLPSWHHRLKLFEILVTIGCAGELLADGGVFLFSRHLEKLSDIEVGNAIAVAGKALERASKAEERAANADLARVQLEASMMWRHLSKKQRRTLCAALTPRGANVAMILSSPEDPEAWSYANEFATELRSCAISGGFDPSGHLGRMYWSTNVVFGVWIRFSEAPNKDGAPTIEARKQTASSLRQSMERSGVRIAGIAVDESAGIMAPFIYVGPRFPPHEEELSTTK